MLSPRFTDVGPVFRIFRSRTGGVPTVVVTVEVSSPGVLSVGTLAVLVTVPACVVLTTKVIAADEAPGCRVPTLQLIDDTGLPLVTHGAVALTKVVVAGMLSVIVAFWYATLPVLVTTIEYVMLSPRVTADGPVLTTLRSRTGACVTVVVSVDVSSRAVLSVGTLAVLVTVPVWVVLTIMKIGP